MSLHGSQKKHASRYAQASVSRPRTRTAKACDRCRFKKSKCDGGRPCGRCVRFDNPCVYGDPHSKARGKHHMSEILDVMAIGLRRLYSSCVNNEGFPGVLNAQHIREMEEMDVRIPTTHAILEALGLIRFENTDRMNEDGEDAIEHDESYWRQMRPDRPLTCHSPDFETRSATDSERSLTDQQMDGSTKTDDLLESAPTSATTPSRVSFPSPVEGHPAALGQPTLPSETDPQQYMSMMQSRYYIRPQAIPMQAVTHATNASFVESTFHAGFYSPVVPSQSGEDHVFLARG